MPLAAYGSDGPFADGVRTLCGLAADSNDPTDVQVPVPSPHRRDLYPYPYPYRIPLRD